MTVKMQIKIHMVAYIRNNSIETVVGITKSLSRAQSMFLGEIQKIDPEEAVNVLNDFSSGRVDSDVRLLANDELGPLSIQLLSWIENIG